MEIETLRAFLAVADGQSVTQVAHRQHRTQPAMSRALARLERTVGTDLFQRSGRGMTLTPAGHEFAPHAREIVESYDRGLRAVGDMSDAGGGFVPLAFLHTLGTWLVPDLIRSFRAVRPGVRFDLRQHGDAGLVEDLLSGAVDLAVTGALPAHPQIEGRQLMMEPLRLVLPTTHRLAARESVRLDEVADEPFIGLKRGFSLRAVTEQLCAEAGFEPVVGFEGEEVETIRGLVAAGLGVALLPHPYRVAAPVLPHVRVEGVDAARELGLAWVRSRRLPPAADDFRTHVLEQAPRIAAASEL